MENISKITFFQFYILSIATESFEITKRIAERYRVNEKIVYSWKVHRTGIMAVPIQSVGLKLFEFAEFAYIPENVGHAW